MGKRVITALIALGIFLPLLYEGGIGLRTLFLLLSTVGIYEFFQMKKMNIFSVEGVLTILATLPFLFSQRPLVALPRGIDYFFIYFLIVMLLMTLTVYKSDRFSFEDAAFCSLISLYVGGGFSGILFVRSISFGMAIFVFLIIWGTDSFAYIFGRKFGKHKLAPDISPNKTIEGSIGGVIGSLGLGLLVVPFYNPVNFSVLEFVLLIVSLSVFGQLGDLVESAYKRQFNVKDSGKLFPGHGGVLDRFDSTFFAMFMFQIIYKFFGNN